MSDDRGIKVEVDGTRVITTMPNGYDFQIVFTDNEKAEAFAKRTRKRYSERKRADAV